MSEERGCTAIAAGVAGYLGGQWWRVAAAFVAGAIVGGVVLSRATIPRDWGDSADVRSGEVGLVNPLLECREGDRLQRPLAPFAHTIEELLEEKKREGKVTRASVYFRDLNNGPWFGVAENERYRIASMLKIPLLLGYLKKAEADPAVLEKRLQYVPSGESPYVQSYPPSHVLEPGGWYTVEELLERALIYSDNSAATVLAEDDGGEALKRISDLVGFPPFEDGNVYVSPGHFAAMLRILFNASYISQPLSEKGLEILARTEFRDGLVAGVPPGITVANKFGEGGRDDTHQLHDCGIVYYPKKPYVLCVMTEGRRFEDLAATVADVSRRAYHEVDEQARAGPVPSASQARNP